MALAGLLVSISAVDDVVTARGVELRDCVELAVNLRDVDTNLCKETGEFCGVVNSEC